MQIEKVLRGIVLAGVFALPFIVLLVTESLFFPYITGKNFTFRIIVEVIFAAWVALALVNAQYRPRWTALLVSVTAFLGVVGLANLLGEDPYKSFWSDFERMEGYITLLHLFAYLLAAGTVLVAEKAWLWLWRTTLGVSSIVSIYALSQLISTSDFRLDATFGNPIYLGIYAMFHIFIAAILMARRGALRWERIAYGGVIALLFVTLFLSATRGATLGLVGGFFLAALGIAFSLRSNRKVRLWVGGVAMIMMLIAGGAWLARDTSFIQENRTLDRLTNISLQESNISARIIVWGIAWEGIKDRPLLGWGQENFNAVFAKHYDPRMYSHEQWYDRTHNVVLDWFVSTGFIGLFVYLSIFLTLLWTISRTARFTLIQKWLLVGLLAAYMFSNLTVFDNISSYILFFTLIAWIYAMADDVWTAPWGNGRIFTKELSHKIFGFLVAPIITIILVLVVWSANIVPLQVSKGIISALRDTGYALSAGRSGSIEEAVTYTEKSLEKFTMLEAKGTFGQPALRENLAVGADQIRNTQWAPQELKDAWYTAARNGLVAQTQDAHDPRAAYQLGLLYHEFGQFVEAFQAFADASEFSPNKQSILLRLGTIAANGNNLEVAEEYAQRTFELDRSFDNARALYVFVLIRSGKFEQAKLLLQEKPKIAADARVLSAYVSQGAHTQARDMWELGVSMNPDNTNVLLSLATVYAQTGDLTRARQELNYLLETYPGVEDAINKRFGGSS